MYLSKEQFFNIIKFNHKFFEICKNAGVIFYTSLVGKTFAFNNDGKEKIKNIFAKNGFQAFYRKSPDTFRIFTMIEDPINNKIRAIEVFRIPVFTQHNKFYFKKSAQYLTETFRLIMEKIKHYDYILGEKHNKDHYYSEYQKTAKSFNAFFKTIDYNNNFSYFNGKSTIMKKLYICNKKDECNKRCPGKQPFHITSSYKPCPYIKEQKNIEWKESK